MHRSILLLVFLFISGNASAQADKPVVPDTYTCMPDQCNSCYFKIVGIAPLARSVADGGCTQVACGVIPKIYNPFEKCAKDWRYSKSIRFEEFSDVENLCVNGVRNQNYWEKTYNRESFDHHYAFARCLENNHKFYEERYSKRVSNLCQEGWKDFMLSEKEISLKHAEISTAFAYRSCDGYFEGLKKKYGFSETEMEVLALYIASRQFPYFESYQKQPETMVGGKMVADTEILKRIFEALERDKRVNLALTITPQMVEGFMYSYRNKSNK